MESNIIVKESFLNSFGIKWEIDFHNRYQYFLNKIFLRKKYPGFVYVIQDHYDANKLKKSFLFSECLSCNNKMVSRAPENAGAYSVNECQHCGENHYVILHRTEISQSGYIALVLNYFPDGLLNCIQPDNDYINPRSIYINSHNLQMQFSNNPVAYYIWYNDTLSKICLDRMSCFNGNVRLIEKQEINNILSNPTQYINNDQYYPHSTENQSSSERSNLHEYYGKIFGLKGKVTKSEIKQIYRNLAYKYHPDRYYEASHQEQLYAKEQFELVNEAFRYFCDKYKL